LRYAVSYGPLQASGAVGYCLRRAHGTPLAGAVRFEMREPVNDLLCVGGLIEIAHGFTLYSVAVAGIAAH
jgi:hypothetical protein